MQINAQQRAEIDRLKNSIVGRGAFAGDLRGDSGMEGEIALRSEIEALRLRTREQAQLIARLQMSAASNVRIAGEGDSEGGSDTDRLLRELADAQAALASIKDAAGSGDAERAAAKAEIASLKQRSEAQAGEITQLKAAIATYEGKDQPGNVVRDSRLVAKARVNALQAQVASQNETIIKLRAEVAASNERLARQAQQYMAEMRRLGSGTVPTSVDTRRGRNGQSRDVLSDRINRARDPGLVEIGTGGTDGQTSGKVADYIKRLSNDTSADAGKAEDPAGDAARLEVLAAASSGGTESGPERASEPDRNIPIAAEPPKRKSRLLERISGIGKA
jgi:hypothetical protein